MTKINVAKLSNYFSAWQQCNQEWKDKRQDQINEMLENLPHGSGLDKDIANLLTEKQFEDYQNGIYTFNIPSWKYSLLTFKRAAKDNTELRFISYFH